MATGGVEEPLVFASAVEGFRLGAGDRLNPHMVAELRSVGFDLDRTLPAYPLEVWEVAMRKAALLLFGELEEAERHRRLGEEFIAGYSRTALGSAALTIARLIGPARTLSRMSKNFRLVSNYIGSESTMKGEREVELRTWMMAPYVQRWTNRPTFFVDYRRGVLEAVLRSIKVAGTVEVVERDFAHQVAAYRVRWS